MWSKWEPTERTTDQLLKMLDFDFFEVLDSVTIARSRKHIEKYYDTADIGKFPERLKPKSHRPHLTDLKDAISYNEILNSLLSLTLTSTVLLITFFQAAWTSMLPFGAMAARK